MSALALSFALVLASSPEQPPPEGGFGSVTTVTTDSSVVAPEPTLPDEEDQGPDHELSLRAEIGYGQGSLGNLEGLDHQGMSLRAHLAFYPWLSKQRRVGVGIGLVYGYQGLNRKRLPADAGIERSKGQQQAVMVSLPLLFRPHPQWFSIQPSGMFGLGFYTGGDYWAADRRATIPRGEYAFVAGGDLALCTAWDIVCVVGGSEYFAGVQTLASDSADPSVRTVNPWSWHVGVGLDVLRIIERGNSVGV
ncbi:MAG TPA: hypothetical protein VM869_20500 [Enhygromyxa sp.]|nr:hypothetical protein [Enhygromyxa sp.]